MRAPLFHRSGSAAFTPQQWAPALQAELFESLLRFTFLRAEARAPWIKVKIVCHSWARIPLNGDETP
jgi:hypothetical protein